jgi:hypothetical protein
MPRIHVHTGPEGDLFFDEPEVARYITLVDTAGGFQLPDPESRINDREIVGINLPGLVNSAAPVIFFRTRHTGLPRLTVLLNQTRLIEYTFDAADPPERSWHDIVPIGTLRPENNEVIIGINSDGTVIVGDVVILYTSNVLTVRKSLFQDRPPANAPVH